MSTPQDTRVRSSSAPETFVRVIREGPSLDPEQVEDIIGGLEAGFVRAPGRPSVAMALGEGARVTVRNGQLRIEDGVGSNRRIRTWPRAGGGLKRLVVGAESGMLTIDAIRWCQAIGVALLVIDQDGNVVLAPGIYAHADARLRRVQATAPEGLALSIAIGLIAPKILGQAGVSASRLGRSNVAEELQDLAASLDGCSTVDEVRQIESAGAVRYFAAWIDNRAAVPRFTKTDAGRVPPHWCTYAGRRSLLSGKSHSNRKAERPVNVTLNAMYKFAEIEARLACIAVGLDPGFGILHLDAAGRDSLVFDLMEPIRPEVDRFVLDLMAEATFSRKDFVERTDGSIKIGPALMQRLAGTMPQWAKAIAPYAERVAHELGQAVVGKWEPRTPLTGRKAKASAAVVKARKADVVARALRANAARAENRAGELAAFAQCVDCGGPLARPQHVRCSICWEKQPGQTREVRQRRGRAISEARTAQEQWKRDKPGAILNKDDFRRRVLPGLAAVSLATIMAATGCTKSTAWSYRSGRTTPHPMNWDILANLS